jgi:hypothetical protein
VKAATPIARSFGAAVAVQQGFSVDLGQTHNG